MPIERPLSPTNISTPITQIAQSSPLDRRNMFTNIAMTRQISPSGILQEDRRRRQEENLANAALTDSLWMR